MRLMMKLAKAFETLPEALFITGIQCSSMNAVSGGGYTDIYQGMYHNRKVAIKRLRTFLYNREAATVQQVGSITFPEVVTHRFSCKTRWLAEKLCYGDSSVIHTYFPSLA
jgi:hypothetical protein